MKDKMAVLGPKGTFTDIAAKAYMEAMGFRAKRCYYPTMRKTFEAVGQGCGYGILPIENTLDGYVQIILDLLSTTALKVVHEVVLPIRFSFVANCATLAAVEKVFVQFKSENQCTEFLEQFGGREIITTASNSQSFNHVLEGAPNTGAIIPTHLLQEKNDFPLVVEQVTDGEENETRFIIVAKNLNEEVDANQSWKTSFVVWGDADRPGLLADILNLLSEHGINMKSIMSRPTKSGLGNYNFFIDIDGCYQKDPEVRAAIAHVLDRFNIKILGSYYRV